MNTTKVGKYTVNYENEKEFHTLKSEIFGSECYNIKLQSKNPYIIDVGAYIGLSVIYFKSIYPSSQIQAFEPNPYARGLLEENIFINNLNGIEILPYAIDIEERERDFFIDKSENNWQSTANFSKTSWNNKNPNNMVIKVETRKLSSFLNKKVDLLKIDIEGIELNILKECKNKLKNVKSIVIEYHPVKEINLAKIISILKNQNFEIEYFKEGKNIRTPDKKDLLILKAMQV